MNKPLAYAALLRRDLLSFVIKSFSTVYPGTAFLPNWHIAAVVYGLMQVYRSEIIRLVINQPPRSLKSLIVSVAFVAWWLGHDPTRRIIVVSYSNELAAELHRQFRMIVDSGWFCALFPKMRIAKDTGTELVTTAGGGRYATSVGGTLTGRGGDLIIVDDPQKPEEVMSEAVRKQVINWFGGTLVSRLNDPEWGPIIVVQQRLHQDDLSANLLAQGIWKSLVLPAIAVEDRKILIGDGEVFIRHRGDALHPERQTREALERTRSEIGSFNFAAQYQQQPVPVEGNLVRRHWFRFYDGLPTTGVGDLTVQSWDIAATDGTASDFSVGITARQVGSDLYIIDVFRDRLQSPELRRKIVQLAERFNPTAILIEEAGFGISLLQHFKVERPASMPCPIGIKPQVSKLDRLGFAAIKIEAGHIYLPREAPWLAEFLEEVLSCPHSKHDDQADAFSQLVNWVFARRPRYEVPEIHLVYEGPSPFSVWPPRWNLRW